MWYINSVSWCSMSDFPVWILTLGLKLFNENILWNKFQELLFMEMNFGWYISTVYDLEKVNKVNCMRVWPNLVTHLVVIQAVSLQIFQNVKIYHCYLFLYLHSKFWHHSEVNLHEVSIPAPNEITINFILFSIKTECKNILVCFLFPLCHYSGISGYMHQRGICIPFQQENNILIWLDYMCMCIWQTKLILWECVDCFVFSSLPWGRL